MQHQTTVVEGVGIPAVERQRAIEIGKRIFGALELAFDASAIAEGAGVAGARLNHPIHRSQRVVMPA
jgi:hypothetical protein